MPVTTKHFTIVELMLFIIKAMLMLTQAFLSFVSVFIDKPLIGKWSVTCLIIGVLALIVLFISVMEQVLSKVKGFLTKA